jgi:hypothetical protein
MMNEIYNKKEIHEIKNFFHSLDKGQRLDVMIEVMNYPYETDGIPERYCSDPQNERIFHSYVRYGEDEDEWLTWEEVEDNFYDEGWEEEMLDNIRWMGFGEYPFFQYLYAKNQSQESA